MRKSILVGIALAGLITPNATHAEEGEPTDICLIANAGFSIHHGTGTVLIDAVIEKGLTGYDKPDAGTLSKIMNAEPPYDKQSIILTTHYHNDHFDSDALQRHAQNIEVSHRLLPAQAWEKMGLLGDAQDHSMEAIKWPVSESFGSRQSYGFSVRPYEVSHGTGRDIENIGYLISTSSGLRIFHPGDMVLTDKEQHNIKETPLKLDYLLLPFWLILDGNASIKRVQRIFDADSIIPMHFQSEHRDWMASYGGPDGVRAATFKAARQHWDTVIDLTGEQNCTRHP